MLSFVFYSVMFCYVVLACYCVTVLLCCTESESVSRTGLGLLSSDRLPASVSPLHLHHLQHPLLALHPPHPHDGAVLGEMLSVPPGSLPGLVVDVVVGV